VGEVGNPLYSLITEEEEVLPGGDDLETLPDFQPLLLFASGSIVFKAVSDLNDDYLLIGAPGLPIVALAVEGFPAPGTGGDYGNLDLLVNESEAAAPLFRAELVGAALGVTFGVFGVLDLFGNNALAFFDGRAAPPEAGAGVTFSSILPGLGDRTDATADGSFAFVNVLSNGATGAFWLVPNCGLFTIALTGQAAPGPGGHVFGSVGPWGTDTAAQVVLFVAALQGGGSGIYRRGP
jgi:hypothetical protein